jgi:hypothetical protein
MRRPSWIAGLGLALGLGLGPPAIAEAQPRRAGAAQAGTAERREQIKKKIRAVRAYTLTEELTLDEATASRLFPLLARYDDETDKLLEKRVELQRRLRRADAMRDPRAIDRLIDEALANQRAFWDLEDRRIVELRKVLSPAQAAKLLVVLPALERRIENQLRRAITQGRPGTAGSSGSAAGASGPSGAAGVDDDAQPDEFPVPPRRVRPRREAPLAPRGEPSNAPGNTPPCDPSAGPCR